MKIIEHTVKTKASIEDIWDLWTNVDKWHEWDHKIESSQIFGSFEEGTKGELKPKGAPLLKIKLAKVEFKKKFVIESKVMGVTIIFTHFIEKIKEALYLTVLVEMKGPLASLLANSLGIQIKRNVPRAMDTLLKRIEEKQVT